jgi:hypothetical protein
MTNNNFTFKLFNLEPLIFHRYYRFFACSHKQEPKANSLQPEPYIYV